MRRFAALVVMVAVAVSSTPSASAETYSNGPSHYHFTSPTGWARQNYSGVDVVYAAPSPADGFTTNLNALHAADRTAKNDAVFLESTAAQALAQLEAQVSGTVVQAAHAFTTAQGRPAADYIFDYSLSGTMLRIRQVIFASDILDLGWVLTFTAAQSAFSSYSSDWDAATDSFGVDAEVASGLSGLTLAVVVGAIIGGAVGGAMFVVSRRKHARDLAAAPPPSPWAPAGQAQPPVYAPGALGSQATRGPQQGPGTQVPGWPAAPPTPQQRPAGPVAPRPPRTGNP